MRRSWWLLALACAGGAIDAAGQTRRDPAPSTTDSAKTSNLPTPLRVGFVVRPDTVSVGDPFVLVVTLEVPVGAAVEWPTLADSAAMVAMRAPTRVTSSVQGTVRRESAEYALAAWNVGILPIGLPDARVRLDSSTVPVSLRAPRIVVRTVLPGDTSMHVPKPARPPFPVVIPWWERWWPALAALVALAALWLLWRRRRRAAAPLVAATPLDVYARAIHDFERLQKLALIDAGERGRAAALAVEVARTYMAARNPRATLAQTSADLLDALQEDSRVPHDRVASLLDDVDRIKFANENVSAKRADALQREAREVVELVETAERARREAVQRAERHAELLERRAKTADEERSRRAARQSRKGPPAGVP